MAIEISLTKDMADKLKLNVEKTSNIEPDILHWYAKIMIFNRKRYILATNTMTRFAVLFRYQKKTLSEDFKVNLEKEFLPYGLDYSKVRNEDIVFSLGNNRKSTAQMNNLATEIEFTWRYYGCDIEELFENFNEHNLGKAGESKGMVFALEEMRKYY